MAVRKMSNQEVIVSLVFARQARKNFRVLFRKQKDGTLRYMLVSRITSMDFEKGYATVYSEDKQDLRRFTIASVLNIEFNMEKPQMTEKEIAEYETV